ncbi:unnamed protein product [Parascedosporium putredinis]|uniref:Uncharacterized protein n=1 Tax=Parascedosporium putredinis TaxID=1442378 RepID=A0A9P1HE48_9PEZI|nr:unnamed protein product [Parascedosporium putredinis]CAI8004686.1 unnamed protein product [Parascedosporium putredinis]
MAYLMPVSRRLAMRLAAPASVCRQCVQRAPATATRSRVLDAVRQARAFPAQQVRFNTTTATVSEQLRAASESTAAADATTTTKSKRPEFTTSKAVGLWLLGSAVSVFGIVIFGGLTRLTESGLSITEWPSPEFQLLNPHMTLAEFKKIYFMEWAHRVWGRVIGVTFVLPALYFVARRRVSLPMAFNVAGRPLRSGIPPRVSQYRLTTHFAAAIVCYSWMLISALTVLRNRRMLADPAAALKTIAALRNPALTTLRRSATALAILVFTTALSGALVAGLDAGLIYNEFPAWASA